MTPGDRPARICNLLRPGHDCFLRGEHDLQITGVERNKPIALVVDSVHEVPRIAVRNPGLLEVGKQAFVDDLGDHGVG